MQEESKPKDRIQPAKNNVIDITGNSRNQQLTGKEEDLEMNAGKDRVGFVALRRSAKKDGKNDRY
ncbi:hypothetical protein ACH50O_07135 [Methylomonas sp. 2BW1-5-20]|uniref:hypothetical protein n=1 Tax=Methylomonas sp. 2BW1-5-20 TaxID=3376686 RepID=UPI00404D39E3